MIRKGLSLIIFLAIAYVYLESRRRSSDALFLFISSGQVINVGLMLFAGLAVRVSFLDRFKHWQTYIATGSSAVILSTLGLLGVMYSGFENYLGGAIKPLDYFLFLQLGIILAICSLSYQHQPVAIKLRVPKLMSMAGLKPLVSAWLPNPPTVPVMPTRNII